jgi:diguanylate cyclase (GGDEF)-like protein/PAS domain S-box-containing protein
LASVRDISERKKIENDLCIKDSALSSAINAVAIADLDANLSYANAAFLRLWGYQHESEILGKSAMEFWAHPEKAQSVITALHRNSSWVGELVANRRDGSQFFAQLSASLVHDERGEPISMMASIIDITEPKRAEQKLIKANTELETRLARIEELQAQLEEQATRDPLTGLYNRRYFEDHMSQAIARADRYNYPISLVMIDIDHFKVVNDTHGHKAGDEMLIALSNLLQSQTRLMDTLCRYGGEEFVLVMPRANWESAYHRANQWRIAFQNLRVPFEDKTLNATFSVGIATISPENNDLEQAMREADIALYRSKSDGRNRVTVSDTFRG